MFELTREEIMRISQFVISSEVKFSKNVFAFTQEGVAMLSSVLSSKGAIGAGDRNDGHFLGPQVTPLARRSSKAKPAPQGRRPVLK